MNDDNLSMEVEFTQTISIYPPDVIQDSVDAEGWLDNNAEYILRDAISVQHGNVEILEINE